MKTRWSLPLCFTACVDAQRLVPGTVDEDTSLPSLEINGTKLHFEELGDEQGEVVIFLHGGPGGDYAGFERQRPLASAGYRLVFFDQRGAGLSRRHERYSIDEYVRDLDAIVTRSRRTPEDTVTLVGHSWGGQYAVAYTARHPSKVSKLILAEPGPVNAELFEEVGPKIFAIDPAAPNTNRLLWSQKALSGADDGRADFSALLIFLENQVSGYHMSSEDPMPFWRMGSRVNGDILAEARNDEGVVDYDFTIGIEDFHGHTLILRSEWNEILDAAYHETTAGLLPNAEISVIPASGHDLMWTNAETFNELVLEFLEG